MTRRRDTRPTLPLEPGEVERAIAERRAHLDATRPPEPDRYVFRWPDDPRACDDFDADTVVGG